MRLLSQLYAFMYWSKNHALLLAVSTWIRLLPFGLYLAGLVLGWPLPWRLLWLALGILVVLLYAVGRRAGYKRFHPEPQMALDDEFTVPQPEQRVPLRATGIFSVQDREAYVLERPAAYWRVPRGQHVFMVEEQPGRFLYQIVDPQHIRVVQPGHLLFGRKPQAALALHFIPSWGPQFAVDPTYYDAGANTDEAEDGVEKRILYFTFDHDADRHAVWKSLLQTGKSASRAST